MNGGDRENGLPSGRRAVKIHGNGLGVIFLVKRGRDILGWLKGVGEPQWDEGGKTPSSSCYKTFPLSCVSATEVIKAQRKAKEDATRNQNRNQAEMGQVQSLELERFSAAV